MDKSRQQFEEWFNDNGISAGWCSKRDLEFIKNKTYQCWEASRESLEVELPDIGTNLLACSHEEFIDGFNDAISEIKAILISNGVKIKNE
ncbi:MULTISPECIES: hypothetical protein [unclassified Providencia]|uniref:hypothetical protein n=1 Tax=unclassified Providencia TaxID=2633465 RepID=UPI00234B7D11|nr:MULTISPECIES: hypothetical protein [unclassified Providencia]